MISIPEKYEEYLKYQRTGAKDYPRTKNQAIQDTKYDLEQILKIKPKGKNIIDIGCGLGLMMSHLTNEFDNIHLVDKTGFERKKRKKGYGSLESFGFYNDLDFAKELVSKNTKATVETYGPNNIPNIKYDAIISFYSWGFHYPIETYGDWAVNSLTEDGIIMLTARDRLVDQIVSYFSDKDLVVTILETRQACDLIYAE